MILGLSIFYLVVALISLTILVLDIVHGSEDLMVTIGWILAVILNGISCYWFYILNLRQ